MKHKSLIISLIVILTFFYMNTVFGQPFDPPDGGPVGDPVGAPIDGGLTALLIGGIGLVVRKFYKNKKKKN
jgi:hypothetical protein